MPIIKKGWDIQNIKYATIQLQINNFNISAQFRITETEIINI